MFFIRDNWLVFEPAFSPTVAGFFYCYIYIMKIKEYLRNQDAVSLGYIAKKMWPTNKNAWAYLSKKLNDGPNSRPWTEKDEELARKVLHELGEELKNL